MPKIKLPEKCGWLYVLQHHHAKYWGFGKHIKNANIKNYLIKNYILPSLNPTQTFEYLYYGRASEISSLEDYIKNEYGDQLLVLSEKRLEWFTTESNIVGSNIVDIVEKRCETNYPEIFRVKKEFLPFSPSNVFKNLQDDPDKFLEDIT
jgi:hypothetical protein